MQDHATTDLNTYERQQDRPQLSSSVIEAACDTALARVLAVRHGALDDGRAILCDAFSEHFFDGDQVKDLAKLIAAGDAKQAGQMLIDFVVRYAITTADYAQVLRRELEKGVDL